MASVTAVPQLVGRGEARVAEVRPIEQGGGAQQGARGEGAAVDEHRAVDGRLDRHTVAVGGVVAVVLLVGVLTAEEQRRIGGAQDGRQVVERAARDLGIGCAPGEGESVEVQQREAGVVVEHLLVVGRRPVAPGRVAKEPVLDGVVQLAGRHSVERVQRHGQKAPVATPDRGGEQQAEGVGLRELGFDPESAVERVVEGRYGATHRGGGRLEIGRGGLEIGRRHAGLRRGARCRQLGRVLPVVLAHALEDREELVGRQVGRAGQHLAGRCEKGDGRPAAHVVAPVHVGAPVVVDAHGDVPLGDGGHDPRV